MCCLLGIVDASTNENKTWIRSARARLAKDPEFREFFMKVKPLKSWEQLKVDETLRLLGDQEHQALRADLKVPDGKTADEVLDELRLEHAEVAANLAYASRRLIAADYRQERMQVHDPHSSFPFASKEDFLVKIKRLLHASRRAIQQRKVERASAGRYPDSYVAELKACLAQWQKSLQDKATALGLDISALPLPGPQA